MPGDVSEAKSPILLEDDNGDEALLNTGDTLLRGTVGDSAGGLNSGGGSGGESIDSDRTREGRRATMVSGSLYSIGFTARYHVPSGVTASSDSVIVEGLYALARGMRMIW